MSLALDALKRAQSKLGGDIKAARQAVVDAIFATKGRESVIGTYDIDENGDTTLTDYGLYVIEDGLPDVRLQDRGGRPVDRTSEPRNGLVRMISGRARRGSV